MGHDKPQPGERGNPQPVENEWVEFPGGELEGKRPNALCPACREQLKRAAAGAHAPGPARPREHAARTLCFQCYRAGLDRARTLKAAGQIDTLSLVSG